MTITNLSSSSEGKSSQMSWSIVCNTSLATIASVQSQGGEMRGGRDCPYRDLNMNVSLQIVDDVDVFCVDRSHTHVLKVYERRAYNTAALVSNRPK